MSQHEHYMRQALRLARRGQGRVEPNPMVGAVLVQDERVIAQGFHRRFGGPHAEIDVLDRCQKQGVTPSGGDLYVTLEPCMMCAGAMVHSRIDRLVYGAADPKTGAIDSCFSAFNQPVVNHKISVTGGIMAQECGMLLTDFFRMKREKPL